jgi:hypothetical protein
VVWMTLCVDNVIACAEYKTMDTHRKYLIKPGSLQLTFPICMVNSHDFRRLQS